MQLVGCSWCSCCSCCSFVGVVGVEDFTKFKKMSNLRLDSCVVLLGVWSDCGRYADVTQILPVFPNRRMCHKMPQGNFPPETRNTLFSGIVSLFLAKEDCRLRAFVPVVVRYRAEHPQWSTFSGAPIAEHPQRRTSNRSPVDPGRIRLSERQEARVLWYLHQDHGRKSRKLYAGVANIILGCSSCF